RDLIPGSWVGALGLPLSRGARCPPPPPPPPPQSAPLANPLPVCLSVAVSEIGAGPRPPRPPREGSTPLTKRSGAERSPHSPAGRRADAELHRVHHAGDDLQEPGPGV
uniref:Uncharacterized protein n=1 Tax=Canis lupus familiaris TaxID=9615 RepID=A0A8C0S908_CANLF